MNPNLPFCKDADVLRQPLAVGMHTLANRLVIQPMEGCDGKYEGAPDEMTIRRYRRFAESGAGLIWFEAVAVVHEGRANPRQLYLHENNVDAYARLVAEIREIALRETGVAPVIIMQATHSGRYSKPDGKPAPVIARNNPLFEGEHPLPPDRIIADDALMRLEEKFALAAKLAVRAGFDGMDVKGCHGYLNNELLGSHTRPGAYGGSFENRTRLFRNAVTAARAVMPHHFVVTSRMNIYDGYPFPYGYGVAKDGVEGDITPDLSEPIALIKTLQFEMVNVTMGNPYQNPQVNRPVDLQAVERMRNLTGALQAAFPEVAVIVSGPTFLRERSGALAAGYVQSGVGKLVGFGRMAFAYPRFARDILDGTFDKKQTCIACGKCTQLMRAGQVTGCVVRDEPYTQLFREKVQA